MLRYYAALLPRRGRILRRTLSVCLSVCLSVRPVRGCTLFTFAPSYERTSKIEKLRVSLMGQRHVCTFRHAQRAAYRTAISFYYSVLTHTHGAFSLHQATGHHAQFIWLLLDCFLQPQRSLWSRLFASGFLEVNQTKQLGMSFDISFLK